MGATNKTTNYNLPLYIGTDQPTYLGDWNGAMTEIDTAIKNSSDTAGSASTAAGSALAKATETEAKLPPIEQNIADVNTDITALKAKNESQDTAITNAQTTANSALSSAQAAQGTSNIAQTTADTAIANAGTAQSRADSAYNLAGTANNKTNELTNKFNMSQSVNIQVTEMTPVQGISTVSDCRGSIWFSYNSDQSLFKCYGNFIFRNLTGGKYIVDTGLSFNNKTLNYTIAGAGMTYNYGNEYGYGQNNIEIVNGKIRITGQVNAGTLGTGCFSYFCPCLYFNENFGDIPELPSIFAL